MSHVDSTIGWYVDWLKDRNPEWSDEQRLEVATGFAKQQQSPERVPEPEEELLPDTALSAEEIRAAERKEHRRYLTGTELSDILSIHGKRE